MTDARRASDPLERMNQLVKERHDTGAYGDCHFAIARDVAWELRGAAVPLDRPPLLTCQLGDLMAIPIVLDDEAARGTWLLKRRDGEIVERWPKRRRWWRFRRSL
jgi:hypothetical protein